MRKSAWVSAMVVGLLLSGLVLQARAAMGARVRHWPVRSPQAHAFCECLIGTLRRESPDSGSPLTEAHLRRILRERASH